MTTESTPPPAIEIRNLVAGFDGEAILHDISLTIPRQQVTAVIGPSGCGKSTLIRCINRMHELNPRAFSRGSISVDGQEIFDPSVDPVLLRRRVGMVFQEPNPFPHMSIRENVLSGLVLTQATQNISESAIVEHALKQAALWDEVIGRLDTPAISLSGGQQQRLCIARSLAVEPDIILMDEPFSALDLNTRRRMRDEIIRIWQETGKTVIFVTHDVDEALTLANRVLLLSNKPTTVLETIELDAPRPRNIENSPQFSEQKAHLISLFQTLETNPTE